MNVVRIRKTESITQHRSVRTRMNIVRIRKENNHQKQIREDKRRIRNESTRGYRTMRTSGNDNASAKANCSSNSHNKLMYLSFPLGIGWGWFSVHLQL
jgi:hypothetical protein